MSGPVWDCDCDDGATTVSVVRHDRPSRETLVAIQAGDGEVVMTAAQVPCLLGRLLKAFEFARSAEELYAEFAALEGRS